MRDADRLRERLELSLDGGQVAAVLISALLLLGGVFALGVLVGKRVSAAPAPARAHGDLAALDAEARRPDAPPPAKAAVEAPRPKAAEPPARPAAVVEPAVRAATVVPAPAQRPLEVQSVSTVPLTPPPRDVGAYTVQVGASQDRGEAARLESRARGAGLKPYVQEANLGAKGTWYRVRVGAFGDKDSARRYQKDVERELRIAAVVMPTR